MRHPQLVEQMDARYFLAMFTTMDQVLDHGTYTSIYPNIKSAQLAKARTRQRDLGIGDGYSLAALCLAMPFPVG